jgi:hypothetical protein
MEITSDIIQDLLPLYISKEASPDTVKLVEDYLRTDPKLEKMAKEMAAMDLSEVPVPLSKEEAMKTYERMYDLRTKRTVWMSIVIGFVVLSVMLIIPLIYTTIFK